MAVRAQGASPQTGTSMHPKLEIYIYSRLDSLDNEHWPIRPECTGPTLHHNHRGRARIVREDKSERLTTETAGVGLDSL